jgi:hypothetical protein
VIAADTPRRIGAALALVALSACPFPTVPHRTGPALEAEEVARVRPGRTTKRELFALLGPPMAIAGPGEVVAVESPVAMFGSGGMCQLGVGGVYRITSDAWLEPFAARRPLRDDHRVYYWYSWRASGWSWYLLFGIYGSCDNSVREAWVLIDETTGTVEDVAIR